MNPISVAFFGTHTFAETILKGLIESPFIDVRFVVTQPDRPVGRKRELQAPPVKTIALEHNLKVEQPATLKSYALPEDVNLVIVAQYGLLVPPHILDAAAYKTINVHTSLLPKYRGASPIQSALIAGDETTGVTIMLMDEGLDTGPILSQESIAIDPDDTYLALDAKLAKIGLQKLLDTIPGYISGEIIPIAQEEADTTECKKLTRDNGKLDTGRTATDMYNLYRGCTPWPGVWTMFNGKRLKLLELSLSSEEVPAGTVAAMHDTLHIGCADGALEVHRLQLEGKKPMSASEFIRGFGSTLPHAITS